MEKEAKIVKVYSNNKKSARLKRNKNKFQRVWDAEKQKYVKVRKPKFAIFTNKVEKTTKSIDEQVKAAYARADRRAKAKKKKSVPVKVEQKKTAVIQPKSEKRVVTPAVHAKVDAPKPKKAAVVTLYGKKMQWDQKKLQYCEAA